MTDTGLDLAYLMVAICCVYKLAWIARQVGALPGLAPHALRAACLVLGVIMIAPAAARFMTDDPAQWIDIARELAWCGFLAAAIATLRGPAGRY